MFVPKLRFPKRIISTDLSKEVTAEKVRLWLDDLAYINNPQIQKTIFDTLRKINRLKIAPLSRLKIMLQLKAVTQHVLQESAQKCSIYTLPPSEKELKASSFLESLLYETSLAYKMIAHEFISDDTLLREHLKGALPEAIYQALKFSSAILVQRYQLYLSDPTHLWQDINQLYLMAEKLGIEHLQLHAKKESSIANQYRRIAILSLSDPHHFMQCEVPNIYRLLDEWVAHCQISAAKTPPPGAAYVVDLMSARKPHYYSPQADSNLQEQRWVISKKLQSFMHTYIANIKQNTNHQNNSFDFRKQRDMLTRFDHNLSYTGIRREKRIIKGLQINVVFGLGNAHHFLAAGHRFNSSPQTQPGNPVTLKKNPFISEELRLSEQYTLPDKNRHINTQYNEECWTQHNINSRGMMLICETDKAVSARVGMIVSYKSSDKHSRQQLGVVQWMRVKSKKVAIGVMKLSEQIIPVSVKARSGIGQGSDFQQALLINTPQGSGGLLLPAGIYDLGTRLSIWKNKKLYLIEISEILMSSDSFTSVKYKRIQKTADNSKKAQQKNSQPGRYSKQLNHYLNQLLAC